MSGYDVRIVTHGMTRLVVLVGPYAVKLPHVRKWRLFLTGLISNMEEASLSGLRFPWLCPVLWALPGGWLLVMQRAQPISQEDFQSLDEWEWTSRSGSLDWKKENLGWLGRRIVLVDYGSLT